MHFAVDCAFLVIVRLYTAISTLVQPLLPKIEIAFSLISFPLQKPNFGAQPFSEQPHPPQIHIFVRTKINCLKSSALILLPTSRLSLQETVPMFPFSKRQNRVHHCTSLPLLPHPSLLQQRYKKMMSHIRSHPHAARVFISIFRGTRKTSRSNSPQVHITSVSSGAKFNSGGRRQRCRRPVFLNFNISRC